MTSTLVYSLAALFLVLGVEASIEDVVAPVFPSDSSVRSPRIFFNIFKTRPRSRAEVCTSLGGSLINNECYQYFNQAVTRDMARTMCQGRNGGDLWTPDTNDDFLFNKVRRELGEVFGAPLARVWIGANNDGTRTTSFNGNDITNDYMVRIGAAPPAIPMTTCNALDFRTGAFIVQRARCGLPVPGANLAFVCEYPITV